MILGDWPIQKTAAWAVHLFTAMGVIFAALALLAIVNNEPSACIFWLAVSLVIDGIDGTLARKIDVKNALPEVDGSALDLIIDYLTYVFIPVLFMYYYVAFPEHTTLIVLACILVSSLYCFANVGMKSSDNYFVGFPATWNIVALYFYLLNTGPWLNLTVCLFLCVLTFSKIKFLHPFRVKELMPVNILATGIWFVTSLILAKDHVSTGGSDIVWMLWWISSLYVLIMCLWRTCFKGEDKLAN
ncbi:phosphatidylcholine/phosphatidylserine synthase [Neisseriaceae bacterium PsAf]|nr:phosphatidylcholine/phosphatidylserine synthase [Neisseriaceae bacterium PsAf]MCV2502696.1 hypothetical protein [Neisseriaceae bacterium]